METEIKRKDIYSNEMIVTGKTEIISDSDIIVPDVLDDASVILSVNAIPKITGREIQNDRMLIYGAVDYKLIYGTQNNDCESIKYTASFTDVIDLPKAMPGMKAAVDYKLKDTECKILNGRKLSVKSVISVEICVYESKTLSCVYDIVSDDTEKKFAEFCYLIPETDFEKNFVLNDEISIPNDCISAQSVLNVSAKVTEENIRIIENKVIAKGEVLTEIIYKETESSDIKNISKVSSFTEILDVDGIKDDCFSYTDISVCGVKCNCDGFAMRDFGISIELRARVYFYKSDVIKLLDDCYSTKASCDTVRESFNVISAEKSFKGQLSIKESVNGNGRIDTVYSLDASPEIENISKEEGKINIQGKTKITMLYSSTDNKKYVSSVNHYAPFTYSVDYTSNENDSCNAFCNVLNPSYTLNSDGGVDVRCNVEVCGIVQSNKELTPVTNIVMDENNRDTDVASVTVYFVREGDSLWDVSKKYLSSMKKIKELNGLESDILKKGMKLFIPRQK